MTLPDALDDVLALLDGLRRAQGTGRTLRDVAWDRTLPVRGVDIFLDPKEPSRDGLPRMVRIGAHAVSTGSGSTLGQRLRQHLGTLSIGGGNRRGSILRRLVSEALLFAEPPGTCSAWGVNGTRAASAEALGIDPRRRAAAEDPVEQAVSADLARLDVVVIAASAPHGLAKARPGPRRQPQRSSGSRSRCTNSIRFRASRTGSSTFRASTSVHGLKRGSPTRSRAPRVPPSSPVTGSASRAGSSSARRAPRRTAHATGSRSSMFRPARAATSEARPRMCPWTASIGIERPIGPTPCGS